ncbi:sphingolipid homeostasis protein orm1 [Cryptotrichosporon argae]
MATLAVPPSPARSRSVSQPIREDVPTDFALYATALASDKSSAMSSGGKGARSAYGFSRSLSSNSLHARSPSGGSSIGAHGHGHGHGAAAASPGSKGAKGRARSSSLITVTEVGANEPEAVIDQLGVAPNDNASWVNAKGAWLMHPLLILLGKVLIDAIPGMTQDVSWTIVNLSYMALSFLMFHHVTGTPFESTISNAGAYDDLTLWEQIDNGAQYTPAKKWLTSVPIGLFLISTHYTRYDYVLFALNFAATVFVLFPKLPILHRLRFHIGPEAGTDVAPTPVATRPPSPLVGTDTLGAAGFKR